MRNFFLTLDFEEWYHLDYLKNTKQNRFNFFTQRLYPFFDLLKQKNIKITVFVLAELAKENTEIINRIIKEGHEIACHGFDHDLLYNKSDKLFKDQVSDAKKLLEDISGTEVNGYRASCFSMDRPKLEILSELGFKYDSSLIRFSQHNLYRQIDMTGFKQVDDLVYQKDSFFEFEIPTYKFYKYNLPISGGGYFRMFPKFIYFILFKNYIKTHNNFVFYVHPFELVKESIDISNFSLKDKFRFGIGRRNNLNKFSNFLESLNEMDFTFVTFNKYLENRK
jgi:polysaccharide deacetylase family protein (PEP-CTERM system associated)